MKWTAPLLILVFALQACESQPTSPASDTDADAFGVTDQAAYVLPSSPGEQILIRFVYSNRTADTVWIIRCGGPVPNVEKLVGGAWVPAEDGPELGCLGAHPIEPGAQLRGEFTVHPGSLAVDTIPGTYRLAWRTIVWNFETRTSTSLFGDLLPLEWRVSNRFVLREP